MITLVADAFCITPEYDSAETVLIELSAGDIKRIRELVALVQKNNIYKVSEFDAAPTFSDKCVFDKISADQALVDSIREAETRMELKMLHVCNDGFKYAALPKHGVDAEGVSTGWIPLSYLDSEDGAILITNRKE